MARPSASIQEFLSFRGITQLDLASELGISQSSVSRAIERGGPGTGRAGRAIFEAMQKYAISIEPPRAANALREAWDMTDDHDQALERLILASRAFRRKMEE
jgi:transcriptional regulator with XRE-family HTH domain